MNDVHVFLSEAVEQPGTVSELLKSGRLAEFIGSALTLLSAQGQLHEVVSLFGEPCWVRGPAPESER